MGKGISVEENFFKIKYSQNASMLGVTSKISVNLLPSSALPFSKMDQDLKSQKRIAHHL